MRLSENYLFQLEKRLANWQNKSELQIIRKKLLAHIDAGYFRARIRLKNDDLLEVSEYVVKPGEELATISYSYHWQDSDGQLKRRWHNAPHHPHIKTYPFHLGRLRTKHS